MKINSIKSVCVMIASAIMLAHVCSFAEAAATTMSSTAITNSFATQFTTIWGVAKWIMQGILVILAGIMAFKTATGGGQQDKTGGWIGVIGVILVAIGLNFVPTVADLLFGIKF